MKKFPLIFLILMIWSGASAETFSSPLGFSVDIPSDWAIFSGEEVKEFESQMLDGLKSKVYQDEIKRRIRKGEVEYYFTGRETLSESFLDNICVSKINKDFPGLLKECNRLSGELSKISGRPMKVYECGYKKMGSLSGFLNDFDGVVYGTRTIVFYFLNSRNEMIAISGSCKIRTLILFKKEYENIIRSIRIR